MSMAWRLLVRQRARPPMVALLLISAIVACATPASSKNTPLEQNTPVVYASTEGEGVLQAISARDGAALWRTAIGHTNWAPTVAGDAVYAVAPTPNPLAQSVVSVRLSDGKLLWQTTAPEQQGYNPVLVADGQNVIVDSAQAGLTALDPADGSIRWSKQAQTVGRGLLHHGVYYTVLPGNSSNLAASPPALAAWRASDGKDLWKVNITVDSDLFASESALFARCATTTICALSQEDGHHLWKIESPSQLIAATDRAALIQGEEGVTALDALHGHVLWRAPSLRFDISPVESLTVTNDLIMGTSQHALIAVRERDGSEAWRVKFDGYPYMSAPRVRGGVLFVFLEQQVLSYNEPRVAALDAATGAVYWRLVAHNGFQLALFNDTSV